MGVFTTDAAKALEKNYVDDSPEIRKYMQHAYEENASQYLLYQTEANIDARMEANDQEAFYEYMASNFNYIKRNQICFNKIHSKVAMISGHQRKNRKQSVLLPQEIQDQVPADELSATIQWINQNANMYHQFSKAFEGALITGMTLLSLYLDFSSDPLNGDLKAKVWPFSSFLMDPFWKDLSLSDCRYIWTRKYITKMEAKKLLPKREDEIDSIHVSDSRDGKFPYLPESVHYTTKGFLTYDEFRYKDSRKENLLLDQDTGETHKWKGSNKQLNLFMSSYPQVKKITQYVDTVKYAVVINNRVFVDGENPLSIDKYGITPFVCYHRPDLQCFSQKIFGIPRLMRDVQVSYNRRMKLNLDYLEAGINRGVKFIEDALVDPADAFLQGNGRSLAIKAGHSLEEVQDIQPPQVPPSWFQEIELLNKDGFEITGINEELMGSADDDKAGILSILRQGSGLTTLNPIFDNLDMSQKICTQLQIDIIQNNWEVGKFARILGHDPDPLIKAKYFHKFDCQVVNGAMTPTQQVMEFKQLMEMMQAGILPNTPEVFDVLMKIAPLQNKKDLLEAMQKANEQQAQQQEMASKIELERAKAEIDKMKAQAIADEGLGAERGSRIAENQMFAVERLEQAKKDQDLADLHKVRAIKELAELDFNQINQALDILVRIQQMESPNDKSVEQEALVTSMSQSQTQSAPPATEKINANIDETIE